MALGMVAGVLGGTGETVAQLQEQEVVDARLTAARTDQAFARTTGGSLKIRWDGRDGGEWPINPPETSHIHEMATSPAAD